MKSELDTIKSLFEYDPFRGASDRSTPILQRDNISREDLDKLSVSKKNPRVRQISLQLRGISTPEKVDPKVASLRTGIQQDVKGMEEPENVVSLAQSGYVHQQSDDMPRSPHGKELAARHLRQLRDRANAAASMNTQDMRIQMGEQSEGSDESLRNYFANYDPKRADAVQAYQSLPAHRAKKAARMAARVGNQMKELAPRIGAGMARHEANPSELNAADLASKAERQTVLIGQAKRLFDLGKHLHPEDPAKRKLMIGARDAIEGHREGVKIGKIAYQMGQEGK